MGLNMKTIVLAFTALVAFSSSRAFAQSHALHYAQAGAWMAYSQSELNLLYAALTDKEYDPKLTDDLVEELSRTFAGAKRSVDRTLALLPESLNTQEPPLEKLRAALVQCEKALTGLANDIEEQTGGAFDDDEDSELGTRAEELAEEPPQRDWALLKRGAQWLGHDLKSARKQYAKLAKKLKLRPVRNPPRPRGKRPE